MIYSLFNRAGGTAAITFHGAFPESVLNRCAEQGIEILGVEALDGFTLRLTVPDRHLTALHRLAERCQCTVVDTQRAGPGYALYRHRRRTAAAAMLSLVLLILVWSKAFLWEIEVSGNETVPTGEILGALAECGVGVGSFWPAFTSDSIRDEALVRLPSLAWLTVNVYGSRAEVIVRERVAKPEMISDGEAVDIVAAKGGFVTEVLALSGSAEVRRGQAVSTGDTLISSHVPWKEAAVHAYGEIRARTYYELTAVSPVQRAEKRYTGREKNHWSLVIGGKRINFFGNSSFFDAECDKIYYSYPLAARGLFSLPVSLEREQCRFYETTESQDDLLLREQELESELHRRLCQEIGDGEIVSENYSSSEKDGALVVCLRAECEEDIGLSRPAN